MKMSTGIIRKLLGMFLLGCCLTAYPGIRAEAADLSQAEDSPEWVAGLEAAADAEQLFVVAAVGQTTAYISMHEKDENGVWKQIITTPGFIGKYGLGKEKEGDAKTPTGTFRFNYAFGIAEDPGCAIEYHQAGENDYWSGDQRDGYGYNQMVSIEDLPDLNTGDSEYILDYPYQYQYCLNISYNEEGTPGLGSAIFLHCLGPQKPYSGGCVAIPQDKMITVMQSVREDCVVVIGSLETLIPELWNEWGLAPAEEEPEEVPGGAQTVSAYLDQDGSSITVTVDLSGGWSAEFARGAVYIYDNDQELAAMGITLDKEVYDDYIAGAADYEGFTETETGVSYLEEDGTACYVCMVGTDAYFMVSVEPGKDGDAVLARISAEPEFPAESAEEETEEQG